MVKNLLKFFMLLAICDLSSSAVFADGQEACSNKSRNGVSVCLGEQIHFAYNKETSMHCDNGPCIQPISEIGVVKKILNSTGQIVVESGGFWKSRQTFDLKTSTLGKRVPCVTVDDIERGQNVTVCEGYRMRKRYEKGSGGSTSINELYSDNFAKITHDRDRDYPFNGDVLPLVNDNPSELGLFWDLNTPKLCGESKACVKNGGYHSTPDGVCLKTLGCARDPLAPDDPEVHVFTKDFVCTDGYTQRTMKMRITYKMLHGNFYPSRATLSESGKLDGDYLHVPSSWMFQRGLDPKAPRINFIDGYRDTPSFVDGEDLFKGADEGRFETPSGHSIDCAVISKGSKPGPDAGPQASPPVVNQ